MSGGNGFFDEEGQAGALKAGFLGFGKSGKTYTATLLACAAREILGLSGPVAMFDTETGSTYIKAVVRELTGQNLLVKRSRSLDLLVDFVRECEKAGVSVALVDSITHPWRELCDTTLDEINKQRTRKNWNKLEKLEFQHWGGIKQRWQRWNDLYLNSPLSLIVCGRAGYDYDFETNDAGRKELVKTGVKMKTEGEFGYEPSLIVQMEAEQFLAEGSNITSLHRTAHVIGDRFRDLDGAQMEFGKRKSIHEEYEAVKAFFLPHLRRLHAGPHTGIDTETRSAVEVNAAGDDSWKREASERDVLREEIQHLILTVIPGQTAEAKKAKGALLAELFGRPSWSHVERLDSGELRAGKDRLIAKIKAKEAPEPAFAPGTNGAIRTEDDGDGQWFDPAKVVAAPPEEVEAAEPGSRGSRG